MSTPADPPVLARWDSPQTTWDGPAVVAAPTVTQAERLAGDIATFGAVRTALLWRGLLKPAPSLAATSPNRWPTNQETPTP